MKSFKEFLLEINNLPRNFNIDAILTLYYGTILPYNREPIDVMNEMIELFNWLFNFDNSVPIPGLNHNYSNAVEDWRNLRGIEEINICKEYIKHHLNFIENFNIEQIKALNN